MVDISCLISIDMRPNCQIDLFVANLWFVYLFFHFAQLNFWVSVLLGIEQIVNARELIMMAKFLMIQILKLLKLTSQSLVILAYLQLPGENKFLPFKRGFNRSLFEEFGRHAQDTSASSRCCHWTIIQISRLLFVYYVKLPCG